MNKRTIIIGLICLILDQITKLLITSFITEGEIITVIDGFFYLTNLVNTGAAFNIMEGHSLVLCLIGIVCIFLLIKLSKDFDSKLSSFSLGLLLGGILGNLSDRIFLGYVRDFLKFDLFGYQAPIFNLADSQIVVGVVILFVLMIGSEINEYRSKRKMQKNR